MVGVVHGAVSAKTTKHLLAELPNKAVATVFLTTGVREHVTNKLGQSDSIIQFPVWQ